MYISQIASWTPIWFDEGISVHFESSPGIGKTSMFFNTIRPVLAQHLGVDVNDFGVEIENITSMEAPDVRGFCIPVKGDDGKMYSRFTQSPMLPKGDQAYGIKLLDEFSQGGGDVQKPCAELKLEKRVGESELPPGWEVWSTGNRLKDRAGVVKPYSHVTNRHIVVPVEFHIDDYCNWAIKEQIHPLFIGYAKHKPGALVEQVPTEPVQFCTPRSFSKLATMIHRYTGGNINEALADDASLLEVAIGTIGERVAPELMGFMKVAADLPSMQEIIDTPDVAAKRLPKGRMDVVHSCMAMITTNVEHGTIDPVFEFMLAFPKEFQTPTVKQMLTKLGGTALNHPRFAKWVQENPALINASF